MSIKNDNDTFVLFELVGTTYAVHSRYVQQLEMVEHITPVPNAVDAVEGVVLSRGQVIPAISLRARFGFERVPYDLRSRLLVVSAGTRAIGLLADSCREFVEIPESAIEPPPQAVEGLGYLEGIAIIKGRMVMILNLGEVVKIADVEISDVAMDGSKQSSTGLGNGS